MLLSTANVRLLQTVLHGVDLYTGAVDGLWGPQSDSAFRRLAEHIEREGIQTALPPPAAVPPVIAPATDGSDLVAAILSEASRWVGLVESRQNTTWRDPQGQGDRAARFPLFLGTRGWQAPWPYCAAFAVAVWQAAGADVRGLTLGSVESADNMSRVGRLSHTPSSGAIVLFQHGNTSNGHAAIVTGCAINGAFPTIEGNTDAAGSREGDGVFAKRRPLDFTRRSTGLWIRGFVAPTKRD